MECAFRFAQREDTVKLIAFIKEFAAFQKVGETVRADEDRLRTWMFDRSMAEAIFVEVNGKDVGFCLFNHGFSALQGKPSIYVECIYLYPEFRGKGLGSALFRHIASIARERDWVRVECASPDWNERSGGFYNSLGAEEMNGWTVYRFSGEALENLAHE